jgi:predicted transcriptional regulator
MAKAAKKTVPKKGVAGNKTGAKTRAAIKKAESKGSTQKQIAKAAMRNPSTISDIKTGEIKNPPANLAAKISKAKVTKKKKK